MNIILCGLPKSGKTTIGQKIAEDLKWNFIDTDRLIENAYAIKVQKSCTCRQIFFDEGEKKFREIEKEQIASLHGSLKTIIAVGGGAVCNLENSKMLKHIGILVYLKIPINILWERLQCSGIPAYLDPKEPKKAFYEMAKKRLPIYEQAADFIIDLNVLNEQEMMDALRKLSNG